MKAKIAVPNVDRNLGKAVLVWEGIECTFMAKITGGVQLVSKVYLFKDRLYEDVRIPRKVFRKMYAQAAAILKDRRNQRLERLSRELEKAQSVYKEEQLVLF